MTRRRAGPLPSISLGTVGVGAGNAATSLLARRGPVRVERAIDDGDGKLVKLAGLAQPLPHVEAAGAVQALDPDIAMRQRKVWLQHFRRCRGFQKIDRSVAHPFGPAIFDQERRTAADAD